ncbi:multiple sugar transport system substrate-binding protein [Pullulanibacillus pueri]|uniref:Sugar ABC transporter substrate-binding protein n=1 Tax=Pullulanibacillus pueri TaxID=1437324 RepID=A0A8J2ZT85_9BACL|nr:ABC transporter substrate-binding protein [Pullulanibacillus pueri]MBM7681818.1 multiple sugar transport system substrate-binding protein [Pullulanibacillus pueri]GGH76208.1 sugar ABC transporter substrate-binding protein [Pullulanibacillus pueri]
MRKRAQLSLITLLIGLAMLLSGCSLSAHGEDQKVLNIWTFTDEAKDAVKAFKKANPDIKVNLLFITNDNYVQKLISVLQAGKKVPDVFFVENTYWPQIKQIPLLQNLSKSPFNASEITDQQFQYIQDIEKDEDGNIRGLGYQGTPGAFYYRRDLTKKYLGTDDPDKVSEMISSWDKIMEIGEKVAKESNGKVHALSSYSDIDIVQAANIKQPWVVDGKLVIDQARMEEIDLTKEAREKNVEAKYESWGSAWTASMQQGTVMFYAEPTWGLPYIFESNAPKTSGKWGLANGPKAFSGGGTFMAMYSKSKHKDLAWKFMKFYTSDPTFSKDLAKTQQYFLSNKKIDSELAPELTSDFLAGQKYFDFFEKAGEEVPSAPQTKYDNDINSIWTNKLNEYLNGGFKTKAQMLKSFKTEVGHDFPEIDVND